MSVFLPTREFRFGSDAQADATRAARRASPERSPRLAEETRKSEPLLAGCPLKLAPPTFSAPAFKAAWLSGRHISSSLLP
jgi:hypothetical protein